MLLFGFYIIKNMDYLIADKNLIKKGEEKLYKEKIIYMPKIWNAMSKPENLPEINDIIKIQGHTFKVLENIDNAVKTVHLEVNNDKKT